MKNKNTIKNKHTMNIAFSINQAHLFFAFVTINSILTNNPNSFFNIYIIQDNSLLTADVDKYSQALIKANRTNFKIELIDITKHPKFNLINHNFNHWGKEIFYKVLFPSLLPNLDRILSLDTDVIVTGNITDIYNSNLENYHFAGDLQTNGIINAGVLLFNLSAMRINNAESILLNSIQTNNWTEQVALNLCFSNKKKVLPYVYTILGSRKQISYQTFSLNKIFHLIARKPWLMAPWRKYGIKTTLMWYKYTTPFIKTSKKIAFYLIRFYGAYIARLPYSLTKKTPLGKHIYKSSYTLLKKVII